MDYSLQLRRSAILLSVIQFFFFTTWIVYVVYLGDLLEKVGIGRDKLIWFIVLDQLVFALSDTFMGYHADRMERIIGRLGPAIISINGLSCLAFLLLPFIADMGTGEGTIMPIVFTSLTVLWIATSSVLRAPPIVLLMKHAAQPAVPKLAALSLLGLALGGAISPYLGIYLKNIDPRIPFIVTSLTLFIVTIGLVHVQRLVAKIPKTSQSSATTPIKRPSNSTIALLLIGSICIAFGFQLHYFMNTKPQYLQFISKEELMLFIPLFWVAFKLTAFPGSAAAVRYGAIPVMTIAALIGGAGLIVSGLATDLTILITGQMLAGGAWGIIFMAGISAALGLGRSGREGLILGLWFTMLSIATLIRALIKLTGFNGSEFFQGMQDILPGVFWAIGAVFLILLTWRNQQELKQREI